MTSSSKIPLGLMLGTVSVLAIAELVEGTDVYFVCMMAVTLISIGLTYNMLGGLGKISGFIFTDLALFTVVLSQFVKVILREPADANLQMPLLTITVYAVFYASLMVGVFVFGWIRLPLPKPRGSPGAGHSKRLYFVSVIVGALASLIFWIDEWGTDAARGSMAHSLGLAFSYLVLFSVVVATDNRIRETEGRHSLSKWTILSFVIAWFFAFLDTSRGGMAIPVIIYLMACWVRGYRLRLRHYLSAVAFMLFFVFLASPFELYTRGVVAGPSMSERMHQTFDVLLHPPNWADVIGLQAAGQASDSEDEYYSTGGSASVILSRLSLICADSNLIGATSQGVHYGFTGVKMDLLRQAPRFLVRDKPEAGSDDYIAHVAGTAHGDGVSFWAESCVSDAFGAFGWLGVIGFPLIFLPLLFIVYDSMFAKETLWGTVALGMVAPKAWGANMGGMATFLLKIPIFLWILSWLVTTLVSSTALTNEKGDPFHRARNLFGSRAEAPQPAEPAS